MLRQCKTTGLIIGMCLLVAGLGGCGDAGAPGVVPEDTQTAAEPEDTEEMAEPEDTGEMAEPENVQEEVADYATNYLGEIDKLVSEGSADRFALVNIDEDDIPELVASDSAGSYDHDNAFIYTVYDGKCVLLAKAVTGLDGTTLCFSEGKNLIRESGSVTGSVDVFSKIEDGSLKEVFKAEMTDTMQTDADDEEIYAYSVNGSDADKAEYVDAFTQFIKPYDPLTAIDYDGLNRITYAHDEDMVWFEQTEQGKYSTQDEITKQLENDG